MAPRLVLAAGLSAALASAAPGAIPEPQAASAPVSKITALPQLSSALGDLGSAPASAKAVQYSSIIEAIQPGPNPSSPARLSSAAAAAHSALPSSAFFAEAGAALVQQGLTGGSTINNPLQDVIYFGACNNANNVNLLPPRRPIYPKASPADAPYDVPESSLRSAIYIPPGFTNGRVRPILFIPGTGVEACETFAPNMGKLFAGSDIADPVYVNIPGNLLRDEQTNAEYAAYAINYISSITSSNVTVMSWSAGGPVTQWALKYWPSTRSHVSDFIPISPDFKGTLQGNLVASPGIPSPPAVHQQILNARFIQTLRSNGGDSAYVPTTSIHDIFDEIVEPQQGTAASAFINDARGIGAANVEQQDYCNIATPAGGPHLGHENPLFNPVGVAVARDAIVNDGVGDPVRAMASAGCDRFFAEGLGVPDVFATEVVLLRAGFNLFSDPGRVLVEPPIKGYAAADAPA